MKKSTPNTHQLLFGAHLPSLPQMLVHLLEACNNTEADIEKIAKIVAQDVAVTAKIIKLANSAFIGARSKFHNIEQAVIYLGIDTVRNLAISVSVHETFSQFSHPASTFKIKEFWYHSLLTALLAKEIAEVQGVSDPAEFYLAGLLHDIGKFLISQCFPEPYGKILSSCETAVELLQQERALCGMSHAEVGAQLAQHWHLAEPLSQAIGQHHLPPTDLPQGQTLSQITALANLLAIDRQGMRGLIKQTAIRMQIAPDMLSIIQAEQQETVFAVAEALGIVISPLVVNGSEDTQETAPEENGINNLRKKVAPLALVHGMLDNLVRAQTANRVMQVLEESLHIHFGIEKSLLLLPGKEPSVLVAKGSFRNRFSCELRNLRVNLTDTDTSFSRMLKSHKVITINRSTDLLPGCPEEILLEACKEQSLLALPFAISSTHRGVLVFAPNPETLTALHKSEEILLLLVAHTGHRLHLENLKQRHADALAREQITTMQETARTLAHEIANPLAIIQNYLSLLNNRPDVAGNLRKELQIIGNELARIGKFSQQLNTLAASPTPEEKELVDVQSLITSTLLLFRQSLPIGMNIDLKSEEDSDLPMILTQRQALQQILNNLLSNSLDAVGADGWVRVHCRYLPGDDGEQDEIVIEVADNGPGIDPAISDRFFRAGHTTKGPGHAGLGLAIVKKLTVDLQGRILHSTGDHGETRFLLYLPAIKDASI